MSRAKNPLRISLLALVLSLSAGAAGSAQADQRTPTLLWPKESIAASQSTKALVIGHTGRAVKFAERALENAKGYDRVVALHNLCLGLLRQGEGARATPVCTEAQTTSVAYDMQTVVEANIGLTRKAFTPKTTNVAEAAR
ncbi:MAG: hypothetical protein JNK21_04580 [Rhodospirillaceae bacterium]|nr:hypothetical protein [Rhodospirillaceae bacterium]